MTSPYDPGRMRIGDHERAQAIEALGEHYSLSRLSLGEYEERVDQATRAVTGDDLVALFTDLPAPRPAGGAAPYPAAPPQPGPSWGQGAPMPYGMPRNPYEDVALSDKSKLGAGLLQILLPFGVGRFYTGHTGIAVAQLLLFTLGGLIFCGLGTIASIIWCVIDGIVILSTESTDSNGRVLRS
ncbi:MULTISPECIES: DUF1707 domain-containing protein [Saccharopolyspora]|nr:MULTISPECIES: DUF1707 domain-containing protein [unclassified Saccharopolyspora]MCA1189763.1 DUF1707 domain-containing protein [Saccharopolyspora sp. 6T]MCA1193446.1 DUF1707 domain-containing protein [Saccharopolyspora sp. 6V]